MNATRQLITRRAMAMGPRLTTPVRYSSSSANLSKHDRSLMHGIFTAATVATVGGVFYAVSLLDIVLDMLPIDLTAPSKKS